MRGSDGCGEGGVRFGIIEEKGGMTGRLQALSLSMETVYVGQAVLQDLGTLYLPTLIQETDHHRVAGGDDGPHHGKPAPLRHP